MELVYQLVGIILGVGVVAKFVSWIVKVLSEIQEAIGAVTEALADSQIDNDEIVKIIKESKDIIKAAKEIKGLLKK